MQIELNKENQFKNLKEELTNSENRVTAALQRIAKMYIPKDENNEGNCYAWETHLRKIANTLDGSLSWSSTPEMLHTIYYRQYEKKEIVKIEYLSFLPFSILSLNWRGWVNFDINQIGEIDEQTSGLDQITPLLIAAIKYEKLPEYAMTEKMLFEHPVHKERLYEAIRIGRNKFKSKRMPHYKNLSRLNKVCNELNIKPSVTNLKQLSNHPEELHGSFFEQQANENKEDYQFVEEIMLYGPRLLLRNSINQIIETGTTSEPWHEYMADQMVLLADEQFNPHIKTQAKIPAAAYFSFHYANPATDEKVNYVCQRTLESNTPEKQGAFILVNNSSWYEENKILRPILGYRQILNFKDESWVQAMIPEENPNNAIRIILSWAVNHPESLNRNGCQNVAKLINSLNSTHGIKFEDLLQKSPQGDQTKNWLKHLIKTDPNGPLHLFLVSAFI